MSMNGPEEGIRAVAKAIVTFYRTLVEGGIDEDTAYRLTRELLAQMFETMFRSQMLKDDVGG